MSLKSGFPSEMPKLLGWNLSKMLGTIWLSRISIAAFPKPELLILFCQSSLDYTILKNIIVQKFKSQKTRKEITKPP